MPAKFLGIDLYDLYVELYKIQANKKPGRQARA